MGPLYMMWQFLREMRALCINGGRSSVLKTLLPLPPPIQWVPGALSMGVKRPGREADHSFRSYTSTPQYASMACCLVKWRDNFTFHESFRRSRDTSVSIVTRLWAWRQGVRFPAEAGIYFSSLPRPDRLWGPCSFLSSWYRGLFPRW
jgi:hypothetical protein